MPKRLLLIGFGARGAEWQAVVSRRRGAPSVVVVDTDPAAIARAQSRRIDACDSIGAAQEYAEVDGAIIVCSTGAHASVAQECLDSGLGVLVEKPLARSVDEARRVADAAVRAQRPAMVVQNFRYLPRERAVGRALRSNAIGRVTEIVIESARSVGEQDPLWEFCVHHLDALRLRFGLPECVAPGRGDSKGINVELTWPGGLRGTYTHDERAPTYSYTERITGEDGVLTVNDQRVRLTRGRRSRSIRPGRAPRPEQVILDAFLDSMQVGVYRPTDVHSVSDNLATIALTEAVSEAAMRGAEVVVGNPFV